MVIMTTTRTHHGGNLERAAPRPMSLAMQTIANTCLVESLEACFQRLVQHACHEQRSTEAEAIALCSTVPCYTGTVEGKMTNRG